MSQGTGRTRIDLAYAVLSGDDDADRICSTIPDSACRQAPRNYLLNLGNGAASKLAEQIAGPRLVLPWLLGAAGAPALLISALMPIKQAGSLLPQLLISGRIRAQPVRKWTWCGAGVVQAVCLLLMLPAIFWLPPAVMGWTVALLLAVFSVASGIASVAFQDVLAKTIGKGVRGGLLANRALVGGLLALAAGGLLHWLLPDEAGAGPALLLLGCGALLWLSAAAAFAATVEAPGATGGGRNPVEESRAGWQLMRGDRHYRSYLTARFLLLPIELAAPLFVLALHAGDVAQGASLLGVLIASMALADALSSRIWGPLSDHSSRHVLAAAGALGAAAAGGLLILTTLEAPPLPLIGLVFGLLGVAEAGVRLGRKTWLVDATDDVTRPTAVAYANTLTGVAALAFSGLGLGALAAATTPVTLVLLISVAGAVAAMRLPRTPMLQSSSS